MRPRRAQRTQRSTRVLVTWLALASAACHGDAGAWQQACSASAAARCAERASCTAGYSVTADFGSGATASCEAQTEAACNAANPSAGEAFTPTDLQDCGKAVAAQSCSDFFSNVALAACTPAGTFEDGAGCGSHRQCKSSYCAIALGDACGVCANLPAAGDSCSTTGECGLQAVSCLSTTRTCAVMGDVGAACSPVAPCKALLGCVGPPNAATCQTDQTTVGASCDPNALTAPACSTLAGLTCKVASLTCQPQVQAAPGEPCGRLNGPEVVGCQPGASGALCVANLCTARLPLGNACTPGYSNEVAQCALSAHCTLTSDNGASQGICAYVAPNACID